MNWTHIAEVAIGVASGFVGFMVAYFAAMPLLVKLFVPWMVHTGAIKDTVPEAEPDADVA